MDRLRELTPKARWGITKYLDSAFFDMSVCLYMQKTHNCYSSPKTKALRQGLVSANPCPPTTTASSSSTNSPSSTKRVAAVEEKEKKKNKKNREK